MGIWLIIIFVILALLSTWMTATAFFVLSNGRQSGEEMTNLFEQVFGSVRSGDLPRAILVLEGEPGPMAKLLSCMLTEATKFTPKLRVAYKVTLESMRRRNQVAMNPLRIIRAAAPLAGILGFLGPLISVGSGNPSTWPHAFWVFILGIVIGLIAATVLAVTERQNDRTIDLAEELGRKLLTYLLGPDSPLGSIRGQAFPKPE
ncbi:MAG: hypothetical protein NTY09_02260 [bacterium]|nr:hypothetical protein [bacterium]